jgi:hypothetical protein
LAKLQVFGASLVQVRGAFGGLAQAQGLAEDQLRISILRFHLAFIPASSATLLLMRGLKFDLTEIQ